MAAQAGNAFRQVSQNSGSRINEKVAIVASSPAIGRAVASKLQVSEVSTAMRRAHRALGVRAEQRSRLTKHKLRMRKQARFKRAMPVQKDLRLGRIYRTGARP
eukprot:832333-Pyramimonas_sp.AAC.1